MMAHFRRIIILISLCHCDIICHNYDLPKHVAEMCFHICSGPMNLFFLVNQKHSVGHQLTSIHKQIQLTNTCTRVVWFMNKWMNECICLIHDSYDLLNLTLNTKRLTNCSLNQSGKFFTELTHCIWEWLGALDCFQLESIDVYKVVRSVYQYVKKYFID